MSTRKIDPALFQTFVDLLSSRAEAQADQTLYTFLPEGEDEKIEFSYADLDCKARLIAGYLQANQLQGERALLLYNPGLEYISAFWGCIYAGVIAVPAYPPQNQRTMPRIHAIIRDAGARIALTSAHIQPKITALFDEVLDLKDVPVVATDQLAEAHLESWQKPDVTGETLAFLQYTSGSTGNPKGVMLTHSNLLHNLGLITKGFQLRPDDTGIIWLPPYHDMGLIGGLLEVIYAGAQCVFMPPATFLQRPFRWLNAISKYRGSVSGGPNFAYQYCVEKITDEQLKELDLSSWEIAFNGAEPINAATLERFSERFKPCGFRREAFYPCYGLAEGTLFVSGAMRQRGFHQTTFERIGIEGHEVKLAQHPNPRNQSLVSCGFIHGDQVVKIVHPETHVECRPGQIGEVWVKGDSIAMGYWEKEEESNRMFRASIADTQEKPFLRTEDLGFLFNDELYITGRIKDIIIIRGVNHYPQDIEASVAECHPSLRPGGGAAFSVPIDGEERLVIVHEVDFRQNPDIHQVADVMRKVVAENHDLQLYAITLVKAGRVPKTSSGKIQRYASRVGFLEGTLDVLSEWKMASEESESPESLAAPQADAPRRARVKRSKPEILDWLIAHLAKQLKISPKDIDPREPFARYGLDSAKAVALSGELEDWLGVTLTATLVYDHPTIDSLADFLADETQESVAASQTASKIPEDDIAIIGMGCRFPGAENLDAFWKMMIQARHGISEIPSERWDNSLYYDPDPDAPGKMITRHGGFLSNVDQFDPYFFGISPREAAKMDPQQRLALEVTWEALENACIDPERLAGSKTGVFMGVSNWDYSFLQIADPKNMDAHIGTGNSHTIVANRISYFLDVHGPSLALDTACSSSLTAIHLACSSLKSGESALAIAGGVNTILSPELNLSFSHARMMSADGFCKTFDASADGYSRAEGCGILILKRLSDALKDGNLVLAVISGSAINQDGRSNGISAPNGVAQQLVILDALQRARIAADDVNYLETHGTGTILGDPIELQALGAVLGQRSHEKPCLVGSVKTNIGHAESASGIAGVIKVVLALQYNEIPPHLHLKTINPHIPIDRLPLKIVTERTPWPRNDKRRIAGVSSFGFGGSNAHLILQDAPISPNKPEVESNPAGNVDRPTHLLTLSAKNEPALYDLIRRYSAFLSEDSAPRLADICHTANTGRSHFSHRLVAQASDNSEMIKNLQAFLKSNDSPFVHSRRSPGYGKKMLAFLFTGQGAQYAEMAKELYLTQPTFKAALDQCAAILSNYLDKPLLEVLFPAPNTFSPIDETRYTQPALFAVEYSLAQLWLSFGVVPDCLIGHSVGEYVAACIAEIFSLEDGLKLISARARLMGALPQNGAMAAIYGDEKTVEKYLHDYFSDSPLNSSIDSGAVSIAGLNAPDNTVISGTKATVDAIVKKFLELGIEAKPLVVSHAFHSHLMEPILDEFYGIASQITFKPPRIPLISNVSGTFDPGLSFDAAYWRNHIRQPVRFYDGMQNMTAMGAKVFLEIGPHPVLIGMAKRFLTDASLTWVPSLWRGKRDWEVLLSSLGTLYLDSVKLDWIGFDADYHRQRVTLPTYPFQRERCWNEARRSTQRETGVLLYNQGVETSSHPLLGQQILSPALKEIVFQADIILERQPWIADHKIFDRTLLPATAFFEIAVAAGRSYFHRDQIFVKDLMILKPMVFDSELGRSIQTILSVKPDGLVDVQIYSLAGPQKDSSEWELHATAVLIDHDDGILSRLNDDRFDLKNLPQEASNDFDRQKFYDAFADHGFHYGPAFQAIEQTYSMDGRVLGHLVLRDGELDGQTFFIHPALLDAGLQVLGKILQKNKQADDAIYLPIGLRRFYAAAAGRQNLWVKAELLPSNLEGEDLLIANLEYFTPEGQLVALLEGLQLKRTRPEMLLKLTGRNISDWFYQIRWKEVAANWSGNLPAATGQVWVVYGAPPDIETILTQKCAAQGIKACFVTPGAEFRKLDVGRFVVAPMQPTDFNRVMHEMLSEGSIDAVIHISDGASIIDQNLEELDRVNASALHLTQALLGSGKSASSKLLLLTRGAQKVIDADRVAVNLTSLWGFGAVVAQEHPELSPILLDVDPAVPLESQIDRLFPVMFGEHDENRLALRGEKYYAMRLFPFGRQEKSAYAAQHRVSSEAPYRLDIRKKGVLDYLEFVAAARKSPAPEQIEIKVRATGLNFRDVLNAMDLYPGEAGPLGGECAGEVSAVGENVTRFKIGDSVMAIAPGSFASHVMTHQDLALKRPQQLTFEQAATIPIPFLTAHYALNVLGKMRPGEKVLIHFASGGVGLAAIQIARRIGAQVFATAGNEEKRTFLRSLGIEHVFDSRSLDFADQILEITGGSGVHLVLNSAPGEYIAKGLALLHPGGRFLEIGKMEVWDQERVAQVRNDISYFAIALDDLSREHSALIHSMFCDLESGFSDGVFQPLRHTVFPLEQVVPAFRVMAQAKHIGKIVISHQIDRSDGNIRSVPADMTSNASVVRQDGSYLITGGYGQIGLYVAKWLAQKGAKHLYLIGLGEPSESAKAMITEIQQDGITVSIHSLDIAKPDQVHTLFEQITVDLEKPPLRGIVHAAGILSDAVLLQQTWDRFRKVMDPKIQGLWNIYQSTRALQLDFIVAFSSVASVFGSPGQSNYAAANAFMDGFAHSLGDLGVPLTTINWGPWSVGMAASLGEKNQRRITLSGIGEIDPEQGIAALEKIIGLDQTQMIVAPVNWDRFANNFVALPPLLKDIVGSKKSDRVKSEEKAGHLVALLNSIPAGERKTKMIEFLSRSASKVLGFDSAEVMDVQRPLSTLGLDSLMALELKNALGTALGRDLPATLLFNYPTIEKMAEHLLNEVLYPQQSMGDIDVPEVAVDSKPLQVSALSEQDIENLLDKQLSSLDIDES